MTINLVEIKTKLFFNSRLKDINEKNFKTKSTIINICIFLLFIISIYLFLKYKKNNKSKTTHIDDNKMRKYILDKMRMFNQNEIKSDLITNLPTYNNDYHPRIL